LLHPDSLLMQFVRDPRWTVCKFGVRDRQGDLIWPENMDDRKLEATKASMARAGMLHVYYMEYFNESRPSETQRFRSEFFRYGRPEGEELVHTAIYVDPAISGKPNADRTAIYAAGITNKGSILVLDEWVKRGALPRETVDAYFRMAQQHRCTMHGVESIAFQASLVHLMREEMFRKKY